MWVVTTEDETISLEGATSLRLVVSYVKEITEGDDVRDTGRLDCGTVEAAFPGEMWPAILARVKADAADTEETLRARTRPYLDRLRASLAEKGGLCDRLDL